MSQGFPHPPATPLSASLARRFGGIARLYGETALHNFVHARVCVIGVGGVGSWVVEALARSGVGRLTLIDADHVAESNINRQLAALDDQLGRAKIEVLKERVARIHPDPDVTCVDDMVTLDNVSDHINQDFNHVVDCCDNAKIKAEIAYFCQRQRHPLVVTGGAGGKVDPTRVRITDLTRAVQDPLLAKMRKRLRTHYAYPRNLQRTFSLPCVWSEEAPRMPQNSSGLNCAGGIGSVVTVTSAFGMAAASRTLHNLAATDLSPR